MKSIKKDLIKTNKEENGHLLMESTKQENTDGTYLWIDKNEQASNEARRVRINKTFLMLFLSLVLFTFIMRMTLSTLQDLGFFSGGIDLDWYMHEFGDFNAPVGSYEYRLAYEWLEWTKRRPAVFWSFTQFTWLTTTLLMFYLIARIFKYDREIPVWLQWLSTSRTLSLITTYEIVVCLIFWPSIFMGSGGVDFEMPMAIPEFICTVLVHAVIQVILVIYSIIHLVSDKEASLLRTSFVYKAMKWPLIYLVYYVLVSYTWNDPYPITDLKDKPTDLIMLPLVLAAVYIIIGLVMVTHNLLLMKFNENYDPHNDFDVKFFKQMQVLKLERKAKIKTSKDKHIAEKERQLEIAIANLKKEIVLLQKANDTGETPVLIKKDDNPEETREVTQIIEKYTAIAEGE